MLLSFILIILIIVLLVLIFYFYVFKETSTKIDSEDSKTSNVNTSSSVQEKLDVYNPDNCNLSQDIYNLPDFKKFEDFLLKQQIVKDVPKKGKISLKFYHFVGDCRKWDKIYLLNNGKIEENNAKADIEIWMPTNYISKIQEKNLCDTIAEAKTKGDFGQSVNVDNTKLMWTYKGLLKYKNCLGL